MPNWVENELTIEGPAKEIKRFLKQFKINAGFSFHTLVPCPDNIGFECDNGGHDWRVEHWGTKWDAREPYWGKRKGMTMIAFKTAWTPPIPFVHALMEAYPKLFINLEYFECGAQYCGGLWREQYESDNLEPREIHEWCCNQYDGPRGG